MKRLGLIALFLLGWVGTSGAQQWERLTPPDIFSGLPVLDTKRGEFHLLSLEQGAPPGDEWVLDVEHPDHWRRISAGGSGPKHEAARWAVYDAAFDRFLVLARDPDAPVFGPAEMTIWARSLAVPDTWHRLPSVGTVPPDRWEFALAFDSNRSEYVMFGGAGSEFGTAILNDLWRLEAGANDATWKRIATVGDTLVERSGAGAIYDAKRDRVVLYGGGIRLVGGGYRMGTSDVIALQFGERTRVTSIPGSEVVDDFKVDTFASCLYDVVSDRMVVFSYDSWAQPIRTVELDDLTTWTTEVPSSGPVNDLRVRRAFQGSRGGITIGRPRVVSRIEFAPYAFLQISPDEDHVQPSSFATSFPAFPDGRDGSQWVWDGFQGRNEALGHAMWRFAPDEWPHWKRVLLTGDVPQARDGAATAYDGRRHRWYLFGGDGSSRQRLADLWSYDVLTRRWSHLDSGGATGAPARTGASLVYDGSRDRLVLYGGYGTNFQHDIWEWNLGEDSGWRPLISSGKGPGDRSGATASYDPVRDRLLLHGGAFAPRTGGQVLRLLGDTWFLEFGGVATWDSVKAAPAGYDRSQFPFSSFDPARRVIDLLDGRTQIPQALGQPVLKELTLGEPPTWNDVVLGGTSSIRVVGFDHVRDRVFNFRGGDLSEAWVLERDHPSLLGYAGVIEHGSSQGHAPLTIALEGTPVLDVTEIDPATCRLGDMPAIADPRSDHALLRDVDGDGDSDRLIRFDRSGLGTGIVEFSGETRSGIEVVAYLRLEGLDREPMALAGDPDAPMDMVRPLGVFASGFGRLRLDLPGRADVSVELFGVNGRRVGGRNLGVLDAGSHELTDLGLEQAHAGVYFARVRAGAEHVQTKVIKLP